MQLLALWPMAKLVLKQSVKAHGPLVSMFTSIMFTFESEKGIMAEAVVMPL